MKNLKYILGVSLSALLLASCENFFDEKQLHNNYTITDTRSMDYVLSEADYKTIGENSTNIALALSQCTAEDSSAYTAFLRIAKEKAFNKVATADTYIPAFLAGLYPQLSDGSLFNVTYNTNEGLPEYIAELTANTEAYTLTADNYATIWEKEDIAYLTPKTVGKLASVLPADKDSGTILAVTYEFKNYEPGNTGSGAEEKGFYWGTPEKRGYYSPSEVVAAYAAGTLAAGDTIQVGGILSRWYSKSYPAQYKNLSYFISDGENEFEMYNSFSIDGDSIAAFDFVSETEATATDISGRTFTNGDTIIGKGAFTYYAKNDVYEFQKGCYITSLRPAKKAAPAPRKAQAQADGSVSVLYQFNGTSWSAYRQSSTTLSVLPAEVYTAAGVKVADKALVMRYLKAEYPYAAIDSKYTVVYAVKNGFEATEFIFNGTDFVENTGIVLATSTFSLSGTWGSSIYYKQAILGEGQGKLVIQDVDLGGLTYVWKYDANYGMKGTAYANSESHAVESWVITPLISMKKSEKPVLNFDQAINFGPTELEERMEECAVLISTDYAGDATKCTWEAIEYAKDADGNLLYPESNSWTFINTGDIDLSKYAGQEIYIGFRYKTADGQTCATWEFKNLLVHEAN